MVENEANFNVKKDVPPVVEKKPVISSTDQKIDNILSVGGSVKIDNVNGLEYNRLVDKYKPQRKDGTLMLELDQANSILVATNLKNDKTPNTKL